MKKFWRHKKNSVVRLTSAFIPSKTLSFASDSVFKFGSKVVEFSVNESQLQTLQKQKANLLSLSLPISNNKYFDLMLIPIEIFGPSYKVINSKKQEIQIEKGVYYQGIIAGDSLSIVTISITQGEISGIISNYDGNFNFGKLKNSSRYVLYNEKDLLKKNDFSCGLNDSKTKPILSSELINSPKTYTLNCNAIQIYFEANSSLFALNNFSLISTANFVNTLFAQVAVLYSNENILVQVGLFHKKNTRMRIITSVYNFTGIPFLPCENYEYGQKKDYLINITGNCEQSVNLQNPLNNILAGEQIIKASNQNGAINATNFVDGINTNAIYQSKVINLNAGFKVAKGAVF
jgi:hypothetical protein